MGMSVIKASTITREESVADIISVNATTVGSVPSTGNLPIAFIPVLGNNVTYTSLSDMMDSIAMLEAVLKQNLGIVDCQLNSTGAGC